MVSDWIMNLVATFSCWCPNIKEFKSQPFILITYVYFKAYVLNWTLYPKYPEPSRIE